MTDDEKFDTEIHLREVAAAALAAVPHVTVTSSGIESGPIAGPHARPANERTIFVRVVIE